MLLKKLSAFFAMLLLLGGFVAADALLVYRTYVRPNKVCDELEHLLNRKVRLDDISFNPLTGLTARRFEILTPKGAPFLRAERIHVDIDRSQLLNGKLAIASVELDRPLVRLEVNKDGRGELIQLISDIAKRAGESKAEGGPVPRICVTDGEFVFAYEALMKAGVEIQVKDVDANILPYGNGSSFVLEGSADAGILGRWKLGGSIDSTTGASDVRAETMAPLVVGPETVAGFGEEIQRVYGMYNVKGAVTASVTGRYDPDPMADKPMTVVADVVPHGISVEYANFRYRVLNVEGRMKLKDDGIDFQGMSAKFWPRGDGESPDPVPGAEPVEIAMNGHTDGYVAESAYELHFTIDGLPINPKLRAALQDDARNVYDLFSPTGRLRGKVDVLKPHGKGIPVTHDIEMNMVDCGATFKPFPLPVCDVTGLIVLRGDELTIQNARARNGDSWFSVNGHLTSIKADGGIEVTVDSDRVKLTPEAKNALPPAVQQVWGHFSPEGSVGLHWVTKREQGLDKELTYDVTVEPKGMKASFDGVPYTVTNLSGRVWTNAKVVRVERLEGEHGAASLSIAGEVRGLDGEQTYDLTIDGKRIPVDGDLRAALPSDFAGMMLDINLKGEIDITELNFRREGAESRYDARSIHVKGGSFDSGLKFRDVDADVSVHGTIGPKSHSVFGQIKDAGLRIEDLKVTGVRANHRLSDGELRIQDIEATCYDGRLSGDIVYDTNDSRWAVAVKAVDADLLQLTRDTTFSGKNITGRVSGELHMDGTGGNSKGFTGNGGVNFKDSELYEVPVLARVFDVLSFGKKDVFEKGHVTFDVGDGRFKLTDFRLESRSMDLIADKGYLDFDGNVKLKMSPKFHGIVGATLLKLVSGFSAVYVDGSFKDPDVKILPTVDIENFFK